MSYPQVLIDFRFLFGYIINTMAQELFQFTLALMPALAVGLAINKLRLPWQGAKRPSERAELLSLLARDVKRAKFIMARAMQTVNRDKAGAMPAIPLPNWRKVRRDARLRKYAGEPIFRAMIQQFREWERV